MLGFIACAFNSAWNLAEQYWLPNLYSLVETAKANGHEPYAYLLTVFTKLPVAKTLEDIQALLPFNLKPGDGNVAFGST